MNTAELISEATTVPDDKATKLKEAQIEAIARSKQTHAEWLGHSSTIALVAELERIVVECADLASAQVTNKETDFNFVAALLSKREAYKATIFCIKQGLFYNK